MAAAARDDDGNRLFEIQADHIHDWENRQLLSDSRDVIHTLLRQLTLTVT
jgi:hypothetical protein